MFSRATKSIVKTIGQRKYHAGEENIKLAVIGGVGGIGRSLSQMLKQTSRLDVLALYDVAALNKRFSTPIKLNCFSNGETTNLSNSRMLTMLEKSRSSKGDCRSENFQEPFFSNRAPKLNQNATEKFVESLCRLPIAEECATNQFSKPTMKSQLQATPDTLARPHRRGNVIEDLGRKKQLRFGEPDCGAESPDWAERSPCHPPKGPCDPMGSPGYPSKPRRKKKSFCVKCPAKKPCKTNKC
ncbi:hypothetical protein QLX08_002982 [Tetragonisca angustula]|uniref:Uncharacterized protein n=1 Tax=Tetragonisca angustula TaxID=166442 RepID=A0AAW1A8C0_9HYME